MLFPFLLALSYVLSFNYFRTLRTARMLTMVVFWALVAAAAFQGISILFGSSVIPFQTFADRSVNLVGKWNDLGLLCSLLVLLVCVRLEFSTQSMALRAVSYLGAALLVVLMAFVNFPLSWQFMLAGSIVLGLLALMRRRQERLPAQAGGDAPLRWRAATPWFALAGIVISIIFLLYGTQINTSLTGTFPVSSLEVRPGLQSTLDVLSGVRTNVSRTLVGTGPNTFGEVWLAQKPSAVNQTPFWNLDFNVGYSTLATAFGTVGLLGALAWLIPLILIIVSVTRVMRLGVLSRDERMVALTLSAGSIFLIAATVFYVPSQNIILLTFVLSGAAFGFFSRQGRSAVDEAQGSTMLGGVAVLCLAALLLVGTIGLAYLTTRRFVAESYVGLGQQALAGGAATEALMYASKANHAELTADGLRLQVNAGGTKLNQIAQDKSLKQEDATKQFTDTVQSTITAGQAAVVLTPRDYRPYFALASVYDLLASLNVTGAYESAQGAYQAAQTFNPTSPAIPLALARLEALHGNAQGLQTNLSRALTLKPDYTDAILFVVQIDVARNDLNSAIRDTQTAVQTAPGVPSIWFELGLLYYAGNDTKDAVPALEQALKLSPNYANAKYFLGLSYYAQGNKDGSLQLFQQLAQSNPDNQTVKAILANLQSGKAPLTGLQQPPPQPSSPVTQ